jgi:hypothetical protein
MIIVAGQLFGLLLRNPGNMIIVAGQLFGSFA